MGRSESGVVFVLLFQRPLRGRARLSWLEAAPSLASMPPKLCELAAALRRVRVLEPMRLPPLLRRELVLTER